MVNISTEEQKRDFIAEEIRKRIIGPGFAKDVYICSPDASDEILTERPQVVYTSGILFPGEASDTQTPAVQQIQNNAPADPSNLFIYPSPDSMDDGDNSLEDQNGDGCSVEGEDAEAKLINVTSSEMEEVLSDEREGFNPNKIGLIACLKAATTHVEVDVIYGRYHILPESAWKTDVKIPLDGRCPLDVLKDRFDYYDRSAQNLLSSLNVASVYDLFEIDEANNTISPKRALSVMVTKANNEVVTKYIYASSFPATIRNKAASVVVKVLNGETLELTDITWTELETQIRLFDSIQEVKDILDDVNWTSLASRISFDQASNKIHATGGTIRENIGKYLYEEDPVKEYVLKNLLEYRFFKREQCSGSITLDLTKDFGKEDLGDGTFLHWKAFYYAKNRTVRYLRILLQNCTIVKPRSGEIPHLFQAEVKLSSENIVSYSEPQISDIDDEFNLNEKLYSDEVVFGKGVNCAVVWEYSPERTPSWIKTTYSPAVKVRSFSTAMKDKAINDICDVHNLSIWGMSDAEILSGLSAFADAYTNWMSGQKVSAAGDRGLQTVLDSQKQFCDRFVDNISYLQHNPRAFKCFRIANSAMYIQMLLGRDPKFKNKGRDISSYNPTDTFFNDCWDYFRNASSPVRPTYYPFQLAFLVMNVKSTFESYDPFRTENVDLIWFPTGGGKTEAYLALTALTIAERRTCGHPDTSGVSVIMRYTLRLLTAQQFERASYLICALEYMRAHFEAHTEDCLSLGPKPITIGMWIGQATSPNKIQNLKDDKYAEFFRKPSMENNPFPVVFCPWCGCNLIGNNHAIGYDKGKDGSRKPDICLNHKCHFQGGLPIYYIDEQLYDNPPTLLFATVDKFAQLNSKQAGKLFGIGTNRRKPDLVIQDELHLISGPLGSLVGLFESLVEELATEKDASGNIIRAPKIIASTATTRNTKHLVNQLYKRNVMSFPASGIRYSDNFFSHVLSQEDSKRMYMGLSPTGHSASELEIRTIAAELVAKERLITEWLKSQGVGFNAKSILAGMCNGGKLIAELDIYWSQVLYYINLKSLGRTHSRISQEIKATVENNRRFSETYPALSFILDGFYARNTEFTSRQNSAQIKNLLIQADEPTIIVEAQPGVLRVDTQMDLVQATNMISVGIDIDRWNVMVMVGQPLTTAEYIQASSRAGRHHQGLVINLYNPLRPRELSFYENYTSYHQVFYKFVEPLSATTFTEMTIDKLILNLYVGYMVLIKNRTTVNSVTAQDKADMLKWLTNRANVVGVDLSFLTSLQIVVDDVFNKLNSISSANHSYTFNDIVHRQELLTNADLSHLMKSLRDVEQNTYLKYE